MSAVPSLTKKVFISGNPVKLNKLAPGHPAIKDIWQAYQVFLWIWICGGEFNIFALGCDTNTIDDPYDFCYYQGNIDTQGRRWMDMTESSSSTYHGWSLLVMMI